MYLLFKRIYTLLRFSLLVRGLFLYYFLMVWRNFNFPTHRLYVRFVQLLFQFIYMDWIVYWKKLECIHVNKTLSIYVVHAVCVYVCGIIVVENAENLAACAITVGIFAMFFRFHGKLTSISYKCIELDFKLLEFEHQIINKIIKMCWWQGKVS